MKKLLPLFLCLLLLTGCAEAYDGPTTEKQVISEYTREHYSSVTDFVETERTVYSYDIYGNLAQTIEYESGKRTRKTEYTYDDRGNLLTETEYDLTGWFPRRLRRSEYTYDEQNRMTSATGSMSNWIDETFSYDDEARTCTKRTGGEITRITTYDTSGNVVTEQFFDGEDWQLTEITRNELGQVVTRRETDSSGYDYFVRTQYDSHGNAVYWEINDNGEQKTERQEYEYDDQGRILALYDVNGDGTKTEKSRREYLDENGSYISWRDGFRSYLRRFDEQGNLIENSHYVNETDQFGIREFTVYRTIQVPAGKEENP